MTASFYWHGCNYPWSTDGTTVYYGLDFGQNVWGSRLGVRSRQARIAADFDEMARLGFTVARWFVLCDGRSGIRYDDDGLPQALDAHFFPDLDAALEIAGAAGIRLVLVLLDHRWAFEGLVDSRHDRATGRTLQHRLPYGRAHVLLRPDGRAALFECVLTPIVARYGPGGVRADLGTHVAAYELMNEPDFVVNEWTDLSRHVRRPVPFVDLADLVAQFSDLVHRRSTALVTLGAARVRNLAVWADAALGLDLLQVHSYPDLRDVDRDEDPYGTPAECYASDRPLVLGEFPGNGPRKHPPEAVPPPTTLGEYLSFAVAMGYAGAWPWSFSGSDHYGRLPRAPLRRFAEMHPALVNPRALADDEADPV